MKLRPIWFRLGLFLLLVAMSPGLGHAQTYDTVRVMTYNLLNYPGNNSAARNPEFRKILRYADPDVVVVQEMISSAGVSEFLNNVLNAGQPGTYSNAPFMDGPDTDNSIYYKTAAFSFIGQTVLHTELRDINGYQLRPSGIGADSLDLRIYSAHLKASQGFEDERFAEADTLRNHLNALPSGLFLITCGDFNLYTSTEPAYQELIGSQTDNSGRLYDPINTPGSWNNDAGLAPVHTQSTRTENMGDGGATGGLDDRFDFALLSYAFQSGTRWRYVTGSYNELGNDGNHFNQSVNAGTNTAVPDSIADALHFVSDHLPVHLNLYRPLQAAGSLIVTLPNGGETWYAGYSQTITWTSQYLTGTVSIRVNRNYPGGAWENIVLNTTNDGSQPWTVNLPSTTTARVQITSDAQPTVNDVSDTNLTIATPVISLAAPDGGEIWHTGQTGTILWSSIGITGNVRIELDRDYPSGVWDVLYGSAINDGAEMWPVTGVTTSHARLRILSVNNTIPGDTSSADFAIASQPPTIVHNPRGDVEEGAFLFTALVLDDLPGVAARLYWRQGVMPFDSISMGATGNPDEVAAAPVLGYGYYEYFIRAIDAEFQKTATDTFGFMVANGCRTEVAYDDNSAETYQWTSQDNAAWAVKFTPPVTPFVICSAEISISTSDPDSMHDPIQARILAADGQGGSPGTELFSAVRGNIGNEIGGLPPDTDQMAHVILYDPAVNPVVLSEDFYLAVQNIPGGTEAFGLDTSSLSAGRSYHFDPTSGQWLAENHNYVIHVRGWQNTAAELVIIQQISDVILYWSPGAAAYYQVYKSAEIDPTTWQWIGTVSDNLFDEIGGIDLETRSFYRVQASSAP